jgi:hypothetical protein
LNKGEKTNVGSVVGLIGSEEGILNNFVMWCNVMAMYGMFTRSWAILGIQRTIIYYNHNIGGMECNGKFNNLFFVVWCMIEFRHYSMHLHFICYHCPSRLRYQWSLDFVGPLKLIMWHNWYVLIMIEHFSKWFIKSWCHC